ncbi:ABC transporter permease [Amphritea sp.]|uniref:ABC transporter permease n=1 Tax=Amphritea sp. TaxID=1872502 RepID=UPI003A8E5575
MTSVTQITQPRSKAKVGFQLKSTHIRQFMMAFYLLLFFAYLFGPLLMMSATAFNDNAYPQVTPWGGFTLKWFEELLNDGFMIEGFINSLIIGVGVICMSIPFGLAGALMLNQVHHRVRGIYYVIVLSPILTPGLIIGISTLVFWDWMGMMLDADFESPFYNGIWLTILGQATFISSYTMLIFLARLQRFDTTLEEAALDLGATRNQVFWQILVPYLKPALISAAVLAFLTSFENYNTTVFTIQAESTLTTVLAAKVRLGITPAVSALAVLIIGLTLIGATVHEVLRRREKNMVNVA